MPLYDGQSETVQAAFVVMLGNVSAAISANLTASGPNASSALAQDLAALNDLAPDDQSGYQSALSTLLTDYVTGVLDDIANAGIPDPTLMPGYQDWSRLPPMALDPSYGLAGLAGTNFTPPNATGQITTNGAQLTQLVAGSATGALVMLYSQLEFASAGDVDEARTQIDALLVAQIEAAAGNDTLVQQLRGELTAIVEYLTEDATGLPSIATLTTLSPMPAIYLAQLLYQDGSQAAELVQRNASPHPLFMALQVEYLQAA